VVYSTSRKHTTTSTGSWELGSGMGDGNGDSHGKRRQWEKEMERATGNWRTAMLVGEFFFSLGISVFYVHFFRQPSLSATFYKAWVKWVKKLPDGIGFKEIKSIVFH